MAMDFLYLKYQCQQTTLPVVRIVKLFATKTMLFSYDSN